MFKPNIIKDNRTMYDGLDETIYTNLNARCIRDTNPLLIYKYDLSETVPIFKDYKNELGYQGEVILLKQVKSLKRQSFVSDLDVLMTLNDKSVIPLISKYEWENKIESEEMISFVKELKAKGSYYERLTDENDDLYSPSVVRVLNKLKSHYRGMKKSKRPQQEVYNEMLSYLSKLKKSELKRQKTKSAQIIGFFKQFTDLQIIFNIIKSITVDVSAPLYYLELWTVMFIPQLHYTVNSYDPNKLNSNNYNEVFPEIVSRYNDKNKRLIMYNTPFVTNRYIRKEYIVLDNDNDDEDDDDF